MYGRLSLCRVLCHSATVSWYRCESSKGIIKLKKGLKAGHVAVVWKSKGKAGRRRRSLVSDFLLKDDQFGRIRVASFFFCSFLQMFSFDRPRSLAAKKGRGINKKKKKKNTRGKRLCKRLIGERRDVGASHGKVQDFWLDLKYTGV